jgi:hypothetical protein
MDHESALKAPSQPPYSFEPIPSSTRRPHPHLHPRMRLRSPTGSSKLAISTQKAAAAGPIPCLALTCASPRPLTLVLWPCSWTETPLRSPMQASGTWSPHPLRSPSALLAGDSRAVIGKRQAGLTGTQACPSPAQPGPSTRWPLIGREAGMHGTRQSSPHSSTPPLV